jgi:3-dehydroquinate dehydratase-2
MKILVLNGPNINMLGLREPEIYGKETYYDLEEKIKNHGQKIGVEVEIFQSNHEGDLLDMIQESYGNTDGIIINPGAYTHTSIALLDALKCVQIPAVEVHISKVEEREEFRQTSFIRGYCEKTISGRGTDGYLEAMDFLRGNYS